MILQPASIPSIDVEDVPKKVKAQDCILDAEEEANVMDGTDVEVLVAPDIHCYAFHDVPSPIRDGARLEDPDGPKLLQLRLDD